MKELIAMLNRNSTLAAELLGARFNATGLVPCLLVAALVLALLLIAL